MSDTTSPLDDLPVLTEAVDETAGNDLPLLTEAVDDLPVLTDEAGPILAALPEELPEPPAMMIEPSPPPAVPDDAVLERLTQQLEAHLETVLAERLRMRLEVLQQQAIKEVVAELKAELPQLLRDALDIPR